MVIAHDLKLWALNCEERTLYVEFDQEQLSEPSNVSEDESQDLWPSQRETHGSNLWKGGRLSSHPVDFRATEVPSKRHDQ